MADNKKISGEVLSLALLSLASSLVTEKLLLMPERQIPLGGNRSLRVRGLLAASQKSAASFARNALNRGVPVYAGRLSRALDFFNLKNRTRDALISFIYDFMGKYSLNSLLSYFINKKSGKSLDRENYKNALNELIKKYISEKEDRQTVVNAVTNEIVHILRTLSEGTLLSVVFNEKFAEALAGTLSTAVDRFIEDEAASRITDFFFELTNHLEDMTLPNLLESVLGLTREKASAQIDFLYDLFLGEKMVKAFESARYGDAVYDALISVDVERATALVHSEMRLELLKLHFSALSYAMYFYSEAGERLKKASERIDKSEKRLNRLRSFMHLEPLDLRQSFAGARSAKKRKKQGPEVYEDADRESAFDFLNEYKGKWTAQEAERQESPQSTREVQSLSAAEPAETA